MFATQTRTHRLRANGLEHHVVEWGAADARDTVVLCHGFLDLAFAFAKLAALLPTYRLLAVDFRGHGQTDRVPAGGNYHFPDYVLDLHLLLPQLVSEPFHLVGHSMGGNVSIMYAATHEVRTLSTLDALGLSQQRTDHAPKRLAAWLAHSSAPPAPTLLRDLDQAVERLHARHPKVDLDFLRELAVHATRPYQEGLTWRFDPLHHANTPLAFDAHGYDHMLSAIEAPILVLTSERGLRTPEHQQRLARARRLTYHEVAGAGHMLHWTHAEDVAQHLRQHFSR